VVIHGRAHRFLWTSICVMTIESVVFYAKNHDISFINAAIGLEMCDFFNGQGKPDILNEYLQKLPFLLATKTTFLVSPP
jgi:hypothetical protein